MKHCLIPIYAVVNQGRKQKHGNEMMMIKRTHSVIHFRQFNKTSRN